MALLNEIKRMQSEGKTEQEIISELRQKQISPRDIIEALSQSKIKEAVAGEPPTPGEYTPSNQFVQEAFMPSTEQEAPSTAQLSEEYSSSQQIQQEQQYPQPQQMQEAYPQHSQPMQETYPQEQPQYQQQYQQPQQMQEAYPQQYPPQGGISPDTITEIAEQVTTEKLSALKRDIEKVLDLKTTVDTKISILDERLKRIESIIDRLNLSILQKVGDYMTNIDDIKKELIETQKSFKAMK